MSLSIPTRQFGWYMRQVASGPFGLTTIKLLRRRSDTLSQLIEDDGDPFAKDYVPYSGDEDEDDDSAGFSSTADTDSDENAAKQRKLSPRVLLGRTKKLLAREDFNELPEEPVLAANFVHLREAFGLSDNEMMVMRLLVHCHRNRNLDGMTDQLYHGLGSLPRTVAALLNLDLDVAEKLVSPSGRLARAGLVNVDEAEADHMTSSGDGAIYLATALRHVLTGSHADRAEWQSRLLGRQTETALTLADFAHLGAPLDLAVRLLRGWSATPCPGINIMLVGPVATGKTELAKVLGREAGLAVFSVGETASQSREPQRKDRIAQLQLATSLAGRAGMGAVILADEAEDALESPRKFGTKTINDTSKVFINQLLSESRTPIIWTSNSLDRFEDATIRRMTLVIHVKQPNRAARTNIWKRALDTNSFEGSEALAGEMAQRWADVAPGIASSAVRAARLAGGETTDINTALQGVMEAMGHPLPSSRRNANFDLDLVQTSECLGKLRDSIGSERSFSVLAYGPPGSGKSEFGVWLARELGIEVLRKRMSDVSSKWVGETEKNIAAMFAEAKAREAMLIIDEIDSLIAPRDGAERGYQVSQVNEMLTWMEEHEWPFIGTTNDLKRIDDAAKRRFDFKIQFDFLPREKAILAFERFFSVKPTENLPRNLTAGNFAAVARQRRLMRGADAAELTKRVLQEASTVTESRSIGF